MLTTAQLVRNLSNNKKTKKHFRGVYPLDHLPRRLLKRPSSLIVNLDEHYKPGSHWVAIFIDNRGRAFYFDPLGMLPPKPIATFLDRNSKTGWLYNAHKFQGDLSILCGLYCLRFLTSCPNFSKFLKYLKPCMNNETKILPNK